VEESGENKPGVIIDYDLAGNIADLDILNASHRVETSPQQTKQSYFLEQRKRTKRAKGQVYFFVVVLCQITAGNFDVESSNSGPTTERF